MQEEMLDIVDEHNHPTKESLPRAMVHERLLFHRVANVMVFRIHAGSLEFLCHERATYKDRDASRWDAAVGGHVRQGTQPLSTALEETREEIGLRIEPEDIIEGPCLKIVDPDERKFNYFYYYELLDATGLVLDPAEVRRVAYMQLEDILADMRRQPDGWAGFPERLQLIVNPLVEKLRAEKRL